eukprot:7722292-Pyramimonas_sp.AAC.1
MPDNSDALAKRLEEQRRRLERVDVQHLEKMFKKQDVQEDSEVPQLTLEQYYQQSEFVLPVFPCGWSLLPGAHSLMHLYEPIAVHTFQKLIDGPEPWMYVHVFDQEKSDGPSTPGYTPKVGVIAQVQK